MRRMSTGTAPYGGTPKYMNEGTRCWAEWPDELYEERKVWAAKQKRVRK